MIYTRKNNTILTKRTITKLFSEQKKKYILSNLHYKELINRQFAMIYSPDKSKTLVNDLYPGLIKGENNLVRSLSDFYATITSMLDFNTRLIGQGVNIFTNLKKIVINPKDLSIYSDYYQTTLGSVNTKKRSKRNFKNIELLDNNTNSELIYSSLINITKIKKILDYTYNTKDFKYLYKD